MPPTLFRAAGYTAPPQTLVDQPATVYHDASSRSNGPVRRMITTATISPRCQIVPKQSVRGIQNGESGTARHVLIGETAADESCACGIANADRYDHEIGIERANVLHTD